ncbi:MAG TPA: radical SAM protein [Desulfobacteria bacterium]|nr:radical SAM protein [Desulfobacteria bacterium]
MKNKKTSPKIRRKPNFVTFAEEIKFLKSFKDIKYLYRKASFLLPRLLGTVDRWTDVPPSIQIEPTLSCNLNCVTCCRSNTTRKSGYMDFGLFKKIIDDAKSIGVKRVQLFLFGESLMHPKIIEMIKYIKLKDMGFHLTTNGSLLNEEFGKQILYSGVTSEDYLTFSVLGFSKQVHEKVMRGINHEQVVENILNFMKNRKLLNINGPVVETVFYSIPENEHELQDFLGYWNNIVDHAVFGGKAIEAFMDPDLPTKPRTKTCPQLWERMAIYWNGDVSMCGEDLNGSWIVGNLRDQSIKDVWLGRKLEQIKKIHKEGEFNKISLCAYCDW